MELLKSIHKGDIDAIKIIIVISGIPEDSEWLDYKLLRYAIFHEQIEIANLLIENGCRVYRPNDTPSNTPLHYAIMHKDNEKKGGLGMSVLLNLFWKGASSEFRNQNGQTPLHMAVQTGVPSVIDMIIGRMYFENSNFSVNKIRVLYLACVMNDIRMVKKIFSKYGSAIYTAVKQSSTYWAGYTPLHFAVDHGSTEVVELLVNSLNVDVHATAKDGLQPLDLAIQQRNTEIIDILLSAAGISMDNLNSKTFSSIHSACLKNDTKEMERLLKAGVHVNDQLMTDKPLNWSRNTLLHFAVENVCVESVKLLLTYKAIVYISNSRGMTPLHTAFKMKNRIKIMKSGEDFDISMRVGLLQDNSDLKISEIIELLLTADHSCHDKVNPVDNHGFSHFHAACTRDDPETIRLFLKNGVYINSTANHVSWPLDLDPPLLQRYMDMKYRKLGSDESSWFSNFNDMISHTSFDFTPLLFSLDNKCTKVSKLLLKKCANVDAKGENHLTPLHLAVLHQDEEITKLLVGSGLESNIDSKTVHGITPLCIAVVLELERILEWFLKSTKNVDAQISGGVTPLYFAILNKNERIVKILIDHGANVNHRTDHGLMPLRTAIKHSSIRIVKLLLNHGADFNVENDSGFISLQQTSKDDELESAEFSLENQLDFNCIEKSQCFTPLHFAAYHRKAEVVELLLSKRCNVAINGGITPLHTMVVYTPIKGSEPIDVSCYGKILNLFWIRGYKIDSQDYSGKTPLHYAVMNNNTNAFRALLNFGASINIEDLEGNVPISYCDLAKNSVRYTFFDHVVKLKAVGSYVHRCNEQYFSDLSEIDDPFEWTNTSGLISSFEALCKITLKQMEKERISRELTLQDFLEKDVYSVVWCIKNKEFARMVYSGEVDTCYYFYSFLIRQRFAFAREVLVEVENCLSALPLSPMCIDFVKKFLVD